MAGAGKTLIADELIDIANTMGASRRLKSFFERYKEETPELHKISVVYTKINPLKKLFSTSLTNQGICSIPQALS